MNRLIGIAIGVAIGVGFILIVNLIDTMAPLACAANFKVC